MSSPAEAHIGPSDKRRLLADVARALDNRLPQIVGEMTGLLVESIPDLRADPRMVELLRASVEGNVATICHVLANDISISNLQPTTAAVEYAQRLAQRDVAISALTRAYYLGQSMFIRLGIDAVEGMSVREEERIELIRTVADAVHRYIDWILQYVSAVHEAERRRWAGSRGAVLANAVNRVLHGENDDAARFELETGFALGMSRFVALVIWNDDDKPAVGPTVTSLSQRLAIRWRAPRQPLAVHEDPSTVWLWVPVGPGVVPASPDIRSELDPHARLRASMGEPDSGLEGIRRSHAQAVDARMVALTSLQHRAQPVVGYAEPAVSLLSMFARDLDATRQWVQSVLGSLAGADEHAATLRETARVYYQSGGSITQTAVTLEIHRNTVRRRIANVSGSVQPRDSLEMSMALRLYDAFGPAR